jgi:deoxyadenosine/deoxycytidine kinase
MNGTGDSRGQRSYYVVVEGPIGVGKTTLVTRLAERLRCRTVLEIFEENPFLADFYRDPAHYAFQTETFFLLARYKQLEALTQPDLFSPYTISDYLFEKTRLFSRETLNDHEYQLFDHMYQILNRGVPQPDLVFYLTAPVPVLLERIRQRGRPYEQEIAPSYLANLSRVYEQHFAHGTAPVVTVDTTDLDFATSGAALDLILRAIHDPPRGRLHLHGPVQEGLFGPPGGFAVDGGR